MYTGIVQGLCRVVAVTDEPGLRRVQVDLGELARGVEFGASIAINGVCLTAARIDGARVGFDVIRESIERSSLGGLVQGDHVNVERSLRFGDEIGGHVLSGHVADTVTVAQIDSGANERTVWFDVAAQWLPFLFHKGFVALDGASLTIAKVERARGRFAVSLIPETIARTTLGTVEVGARVNLEIDAQTQAIVTTVERLLRDPEFRRALPA